LNWKVPVSRPPAKKVGGKRQSTRIRIPSKRTTDPNNAEATGSAGEDASSGRKRKVGISGASRRVARKVVESESGSEKSSDDGNKSASDDEQPDSNDTVHNSDNDDDDTCMDAKYDRLKSLGDEDREVRAVWLTYFKICTHKLLQLAKKLSRLERTADVRTIFQRDDNCVNTDTGKVEKGNWCTICKYVIQV